MIRNVTPSECGKPGSASTATQLSIPIGMIAPMPFQLVKLRASTPTSGMRPNAVKNTSAGSTSQPSDPCCRTPTSALLTTWGPRSCCSRTAPG